MNNLLIQKFNEYLSRIFTELNELALHEEYAYLSNQLLDRLEIINRQTFTLNHYIDGYDQYGDKLVSIKKMTEENLRIVNEFIVRQNDESTNLDELKILFFLMDDLFYQAHMLLTVMHFNS